MARSQMFAMVAALLVALMVVAPALAAPGYGDSHTSLHNGLGYNYNYAIAHGPHSYGAHGSSYPNGYGGLGAPGYHAAHAYYPHF